MCMLKFVVTFSSPIGKKNVTTIYFRRNIMYVEICCDIFVTYREEKCHNNFFLEGILCVC